METQNTTTIITLWENILTAIKQELTDSNYNTWFWKRVKSYVATGQWYGSWWWVSPNELSKKLDTKKIFEFYE